MQNLKNQMAPQELLVVGAALKADLFAVNMLANTKTGGDD